MTEFFDNFDLRIKAKFANVILTRDQMHAYQDIAYDHLLNNPYSALFIDMGLGKTITSLTLACDLLGDFEVNKVLVIGPLRVATDTWPNEIGKWAHTAAFNHSVVHVDDDDPRIKKARSEARARVRADCAGRPMFKSEIDKEIQAAETRAGADCKEELRRAAAFSSASIHIISRDWIEWLVNVHGVKWPYDCVIIDESSGFKDHNSGRFKALAKVRNSNFKDGTPMIKRLHCLTATPAAETYEHLFAQMFLMDGGKRFGTGITKFREKYFTYNKYSMKWKLRDGCEDEILAKISDICLVMKSKEYLDMEDPIIAQRIVHMTESEKVLYDTMANDMIVTLADGSEIEAETAAALSSKLLQMASGVLYETRLEPGQTEDDDHVKIKKIHSIHDHKIEMLKEIVEQSQGKPILVGYHFKSSLARLLKAFPKAVAMDKTGKCIKDWNKCKIPMLLMHPQSGGHGLNLQDGGHNVVFFDIPWSLELYLQFIGRLARQGQKFRVLVQLLVCQGTLDTLVCEALQAKEDAQEMMFVILKRIKAKMKKAKATRQPVKADLTESIIDALRFLGEDDEL